MSCIVDLDDLATWPAGVNALVHEYADRLRGTTEYTADLKLDAGDERCMDKQLVGHGLVVYHCTRLLPHEDEMIRSQGLRLLTLELVRDRIEAAYRHGYITDAERDAFHSSHVFAAREHRNREKGADVIVGTSAFKDMAHACNPLLSTWGGEAMYMSSRRIDEGRLRQLGQPAIVVAHLLCDRPQRVANYSRTLLRPFVGMQLGLEQPGTQLKLREPLRPDEIIDIWHPGDTAYDRFPRLRKR